MAARRPWVVEGLYARLLQQLANEASGSLNAPIEYQQEKSVPDFVAPVKLSPKALLEKLHLKYSQKSWTDSYKVVRFCLDKPAASTIRSLPDHPILVCSNTLQEAVKAKTLSTLLTRIESISKEKGLESHLDASGRICYITSEMFYIEVRVKKNGYVVCVKLAHHGEIPKICKELLLLLRANDFEGFGKSLEGLLQIYNFPGNSDVKAKMYLALCSLEEDMRSLYSVKRPRANTTRVEHILYGRAGFVSQRSGGTPMKLEYYISPYQILEEKLTGIYVTGSNVSLTITGTAKWYRLPVAPLFKLRPPEEESPPELLALCERGMKLPACFLLRFENPEPILLCIIEEIQKETGFPVTITKTGPLHELVIEKKYKHLMDLVNDKEIQFVVSLPDCKDQCYVLNGLNSKNGVSGALVSKIPFTNPCQVTPVLELLRLQAAYNTLLSSCISSKCHPKDTTSMLHFEVCLQKNLGICIFFQHPNGDSLACVAVNVLNCIKLTCSLYSSSSDPPLPCSKEVIVNVLERCMSIPQAMRTIYKKAQNEEVSINLEVHYDIEKSPSPPQHSGNLQTEMMIEPHSELQDTQSISEENADDGVHSSDCIKPSSCPAEETKSSYTEDVHCYPVEIHSSGTDERHSGVAKESPSSPMEEPSSSIVQQLGGTDERHSGVAEESPSSPMEEPSSSIVQHLGGTDERHSGVAEESPSSPMEEPSSSIVQHLGGTDERHSGVAEESPSSPMEEPSSSIVQQLSGTDEHHSGVAEESPSSPMEEPCSSIAQQLSPILPQCSTSGMTEDPSSSTTEELSSSFTEEFSLNIPGLLRSQSTARHDVD